MKEILKDKKIIVTGSSSGIGKAAAKQFALFGAEIILMGRNSERLAEVSNAISGNCIDVVEHDFSNADSTFDILKKIADEHGPIDGIFHSAGKDLLLPVKLVKDQHIEDVFAASLYASFGIARAAANRKIFSDQSSIVYMSSVASAAGKGGMTVYSSSKAALDGLVRSAACELAARRIRVNSIQAGAVKTEMHERISASGLDSAIKEYEAAHLLGFGEPVDIANMAAFLLCDMSTWITGSSIVVDGGYLVR